MAGASHHILDRPTFDDPVKVLIVASPYYKDISDNQIAGAIGELDAAGATHEVIFVPGALEIPTAIGIAERMSNFDGFVALGCVIRGGTPHFDYVCQAANDSIARLNLELDSPVIFGVLTLENEAQAWERLGGAHGHKGKEAALTALAMMEFKQKL